MIVGLGLAAAAEAWAPDAWKPSAIVGGYLGNETAVQDRDRVSIAKSSV